MPSANLKYYTETLRFHVIIDLGFDSDQQTSYENLTFQLHQDFSKIQSPAK